MMLQASHDAHAAAFTPADFATFERNRSVHQALRIIKAGIGVDGIPNASPESRSRLQATAARVLVRSIRTQAQWLGIDVTGWPDE